MEDSEVLVGPLEYFSFVLLSASATERNVFSFSLFHNFSYFADHTFHQNQSRIRIKDLEWSADKYCIHDTHDKNQTRMWKIWLRILISDSKMRKLNSPFILEFWFSLKFLTRISELWPFFTLGKSIFHMFSLKSFSQVALSHFHWKASVLQRTVCGEYVVQCSLQAFVGCVRPSFSSFDCLGLMLPCTLIHCKHALRLLNMNSSLHVKPSRALTILCHVYWCCDVMPVVCFSKTSRRFHCLHRNYVYINVT